MKLFVFDFNSEITFYDFVKFWAVHYDRENDKKYNHNIDINPLEKENLIELFKWKNQMNLSNPKMKSLEIKILSKLNIINKFKNDGFDYKEFEKEFSNVSFVWRKFLLHIINPNEYPIYDINIHQSFEYIVDLKYNDKEKLYRDYILFLKKNRDLWALKTIDEALYSFAIFIKRKYKRIIDKISGEFISVNYKINDIDNWKNEIKYIIRTFIKEYETDPMMIYLNEDNFKFIQNQIINDKIPVCKYYDNDNYDVVNINSDTFVERILYRDIVIDFFEDSDLDKNIIKIIADQNTISLVLRHEGELFFDLNN